MAAGIRVFTALALAIGAMGPTWAAAKPDGGRCECGVDMEAPALCKSLTAPERDTCLMSNTKWRDACIAWREQACHAPLSLAPVKLVANKTSLTKFAGSWTGKTVCQKQGTFRLMMSVAQQHDGSFGTRAATDGPGEFTQIAFNENQVILVYSSLFRDRSYTGRLTAADRIEGSVRINTDNCSWYLAK